ncbi:hypothetical protein SSS_01136 [Sarcoptes scabiei]|uniref:Uncharacterized protein n=1 Tax=Sarcoptes scabiei TaxID=52283 RepID=A0A834R7B4_SARSC|nr:hypothetical protein SSS_01136 [Sarcoptes scabiei]
MNSTNQNPAHTLRYSTHQNSIEPCLRTSGLETKSIELKELKDYFDVKYSRLKVLEEKINDLFTEDRSFDVYHSCRSRDLESKEKNCFENNNCYSYCGNSNEYPRKKTDLLIQNDDDDDDDDDDDNVDNNPNNPNGNKTNDSNSLMFEPIINIQIKDEINEEFVEEVEEQEEEDEDNGLEEVEKEVIENDGNNKDDGILAKKIYTGRRNFSTENQTKIVNNQSDVSNESMKITPIKTLVGKKLAANIHTKNEFMQMIQRCKQERSLTKEKISANVYMLRCSDDNSILGYQCSIDDCSYMHFLRAQVNRHFKNFHSKICSHCNQRFRRPYELSLHLKEIGRKQQSQLE